MNVSWPPDANQHFSTRLRNCIQIGIRTVSREHSTGGNMSPVVAWGSLHRICHRHLSHANTQVGAARPSTGSHRQGGIDREWCERELWRGQLFPADEVRRWPNRAYNSFYSAVDSWGHYELVGETTDADLVLVIKFTNPAVERLRDRNADDGNGSVYDPQLNLSINDPKTGLPLWTITEHIEPGGDRVEANGRFDDAVTRLVDDLKQLNLRPDLTLLADSPPPGAIATARREQRERHAGAGLLLGFAVGGIIALSEGGHDPCTDLGNFGGCVASGKRQARNEVFTSLGAALAGALIGWAWPVSY